jgi:hypothetical protein
MNTFRKSFTLLLFSLIGSHCIITASNAAGYIMVREGDGVRECSIPAIPGEYYVGNYGCTNDQAYTVRFVNVPSALHITFLDDRWPHGGNCRWNDSWEIEVRTTKDPTTTPADSYISLAVMYSAPLNSVIAPGVLKIRHRAGDSQINGHLSCVSVSEGQ